MECTENRQAVVIDDTTLRDGEQSPGFSMNIKEKLEMAAQLARLCPKSFVALDGADQDHAGA